jgi:hypothetical protein
MHPDITWELQEYVPLTAPNRSPAWLLVSKTGDEAIAKAAFTKAMSDGREVRLRRVLTEVVAQARGGKRL